MQAQSTGFEAGAYVGIPFGEAGNSTSINLGVSVGYYWNNGESFHLGGLAGYDYFLGKSVDDGFGGEYKQNVGFIPIAVSGKYYFGQFFVGADLGYAIGTDTGMKGGFLYRPRVGWSNTAFDVYAYYKGINCKSEVTVIMLGGPPVSSSSSFNAGSAGLGFSYKF